MCERKLLPLDACWVIYTVSTVHTSYTLAGLIHWQEAVSVIVRTVARGERMGCVIGEFLQISACIFCVRFPCQSIACAGHSPF